MCDIQYLKKRKETGAKYFVISTDIGVWLVSLFNADLSPFTQRNPHESAYIYFTWTYSRQEAVELNLNIDQTDHTAILWLSASAASESVRSEMTKSLVSQHISVWRKGARGNACPTHHTPAFLFTSKNHHPRFSSSECSVSQVSSMLTHLCLTGLQHNVHELKSVEGYIQR